MRLVAISNSFDWTHFAIQYDLQQDFYRALFDWYIKEMLRIPHLRRNLTNEEWETFRSFDDTAIARPLQAPTSLVALLKATDGNERTPSLRGQHNDQAHTFSYVDFVEATEGCTEEKEATLCKLIVNFKYGHTIFDV